MLRTTLNVSLFLLIRYTKLIGTDYSARSIELCRKIAEQRGLSNIKFEVIFIRRLACVDL